MQTVTCLGVGRLNVGPEWKARPHRHPHVEMMVIFLGRLSIRIGHETISVGAGDVLYYPPRVSHEEHGIGDSPLDFIFFACDRDLQKQPYVTCDSSGRIRLLASWLLEEQSSSYTGKREVMNAALGALLAEAVKARTEKLDPRVESVRAFMREQLAEPLQVSAIAAHLNLSRAHFIRTYRRLTGRTPMEDLRILRVETARHLLTSTDEPLKVIARKAGFCDEYHLSRVFRRHLQVPPGYFRKS